MENEETLKQHRLSVSVVIHSDTTGLKSALFDTFAHANIGAKIGPHSHHTTPVIFEGPATLILQTKLLLQKTLNENYPGIGIDWSEPVESTEPLTKVTIVETPPEFKRTGSSGEFKDIELKELSFAGSANTESVKQLVGQAISNYILPLARMMGKVNEKHITITHSKSNVFIY